MSKETCIFGSLFQAERSKTTFSQWEVSVRAGTHLSNVNQIEAGNQEPNVLVALKMLLAVNTPIPSFFATLYAHLPKVMVSSKIPVISQHEYEAELKNVSAPTDERKLFGLLFYTCRKVTTLSQNYISSIAHYDHRSLQRVEKGLQIPGVMNAGKLVAATGIDIGLFFDIFAQKVKDIDFIKDKKLLNESE